LKTKRGYLVRRKFKFRRRNLEGRIHVLRLYIRCLKPLARYPIIYIFLNLNRSTFTQTTARHNSPVKNWPLPCPKLQSSFVFSTQVIIKSSPRTYISHQHTFSPQNAASKEKTEKREKKIYTTFLLQPPPHLSIQPLFQNSPSPLLKDLYDN